MPHPMTDNGDMRILALALVPLLALAACNPKPGQKQEPVKEQLAPSVPGTPQQAATDFSQPILARGTEPFWALKMEGTTFTLQRPDHADVVFHAPGAQISPGKGVWPAASADGQKLTVSLFVTECSDGMSDRRYPMTAELELAGQTLRGCAGKAADMAQTPSAR